MTFFLYTCRKTAFDDILTGLKSVKNVIFRELAFIFFRNFKQFNFTGLNNFVG